MAQRAGIAEQLAALKLQSQALPAVRTVSPVITAEGVKGLKRFILPIAAGGIGQTLIVGNFFFVESLQTTVGLLQVSGTVLPVNVKPDTGDISVPLYNAGAKYRYETPFNRLEFVNNASNPAVTLVVWAGFGNYDAPVVRQGWIEQSFGATNIVTDATAYAIGNGVGSGTNTVAGFFIPGLQRCALVRARLALNVTAVAAAGADIALVMCNGDSTISATDHVAYLGSYSDLPALQPPIRFPSFISDGPATAFCYCDVTDIQSAMFSGSSSTGLAMFWVLVAKAAFTLANPCNLRLDLTAKYW